MIAVTLGLALAPSSVAAGASFTSRAESELSVASSGVKLVRTVFKKEYGGSSYSWITPCPGYSEIPENVGPDSSSTFCYGTYSGSSGAFEYDTGFFFYYDILIPNGKGGWKPSGYYLDGATKVPLTGEPKIDCTIKKSGTTEASTGAPFKCAYNFTGSGNTSSPHWKLTANPINVIDASKSDEVEKASELIGANCKEISTVQCAFGVSKNTVSVFLQDKEKWEPLTHWADSCPPTDPQRPFVLTATESVTVSWSDAVGGKISGKLKVNTIISEIEVTLEANYLHTITQGDTYGQGYQWTIPYGWRAALYLEHGILQVTSDFNIITNKGERYLVKNAVFQFPLSRDVYPHKDGGQPVRRAVVQHVQVRCDKDMPRGGFRGVPRGAITGPVKPPKPSKPPKLPKPPKRGDH